MQLRRTEPRLEVIEPGDVETISLEVIANAHNGRGITVDHDRIYIGYPDSVCYEVVKWLPNQASLKLRRVR